MEENARAVGVALASYRRPLSSSRRRHRGNEVAGSDAVEGSGNRRPRLLRLARGTPQTETIMRMGAASPTASPAVAASTLMSVN